MTTSAWITLLVTEVAITVATVYFFARVVASSSRKAHPEDSLPPPTL